ncbi:MAG: protealysin inhibitor emfourin [Candidatus Aminicenantales bacterium]|jgi:hypothetical protein
MKIIVKRSGGFAGPLLDKTVEIDSGSLSPNDEKTLNALLSAVPFAGLHNQRFHARGGADIMKYEVTIDAPQGVAVFYFDESAVPEDFRPAWQFITRHFQI